MPGARNTDRQEIHRAGDLPVPEEPNPRTSAKWKKSRPLALKYVDDGMTLEALNFETVGAVSGKNRKHAVQSQNVFRSVVSKARSRGMKVNTAKTNLMVVSDSLGSEKTAFVVDGDGNELESTKKMKILGFHMSDRPTVAAHVEALRKILAAVLDPLPFEEIWVQPGRTPQGVQGDHQAGGILLLCCLPLDFNG